MNKLIKSGRLLFFAFLFVLLVLPSYATTISDLSSIGVGARALGLGRAYLGIPTDVDSIFFNPAGLVGINSLNIDTMRGSLMGDVNYTVLSAAHPFLFGNLGVGFIYSQIPQIPLTRFTSSNGLSRPDVYGYTDYNSGLSMISYSTAIKRLKLGATLKYFFQGFSENSGSMEGSSGSGINIDLGAQFNANKWLTLGAAITNAMAGNLGGKFVWKKNNFTENMPSVLKAGAGINLLGENGLRNIGSQEAILLFDVEKGIAGTNMPYLAHSGIEWKPVKAFAFRIGIDQQESASTTKTEVESNLTFGIGLRANPVTFDYAYHRYGDMAENSTHYFSLGYSPDGRTVTFESSSSIGQKQKIINFLNNLFKDEE